MAENNYYIVKRYRMLEFLISKGFTDYKIIPDPTSSRNYNWFLFEQTEALKEAVKEYFACKAK